MARALTQENRHHARRIRDALKCTVQVVNRPERILKRLERTAAFGGKEREGGRQELQLVAQLLSRYAKEVCTFGGEERPRPCDAVSHLRQAAAQLSSQTVASKAALQAKGFDGSEKVNASVLLPCPEQWLQLMEVFPFFL